jgi:hypothetical protein
MRWLAGPVSCTMIAGRMAAPMPELAAVLMAVQYVNCASGHALTSQALEP